MGDSASSTGAADGRLIGAAAAASAATAAAGLLRGGATLGSSLAGPGAAEEGVGSTGGSGGAGAAASGAGGEAEGAAPSEDAEGEMPGMRAAAGAPADDDTASLGSLEESSMGSGEGGEAGAEEEEARSYDFIRPALRWLVHTKGASHRYRSPLLLNDLASLPLLQDGADPSSQGDDDVIDGTTGPKLVPAKAASQAVVALVRDTRALPLALLAPALEHIAATAVQGRWGLGSLDDDGDRAAARQASRSQPPPALVMRAALEAYKQHRTAARSVVAAVARLVAMRPVWESEDAWHGLLRCLRLAPVRAAAGVLALLPPERIASLAGEEHAEKLLGRLQAAAVREPASCAALPVASATALGIEAAMSDVPGAARAEALEEAKRDAKEALERALQFSLDGSGKGPQGAGGTGAKAGEKRGRDASDRDRDAAGSSSGGAGSAAKKARQ